MEEEKKKKKNKKKKKKQNKGTDDTSSAGGETASRDEINVSEQDDQNQYSGIADARDNGGHYANSSNGSFLAESERQDWLQREARLQEMIKQLQYEKDLYIQREAGLEMKLLQLQSEQDTWHQKEAILELKASQLLQEKATLNEDKVYLQEKVKNLERERAFWVEKENSGKEMIAHLNDDNRRLQIQGADEGEDLKSQIEAACALVEKLITENAELVEKVNELYIELGRQAFRSEVTSIVVPDSVDSSTDGTIQDPASESSEGNAASTESVKPLEGALKMVGDDVGYEYAAMARDSSGTSVSGEIVQIPLDENQMQDLEATAVMNEENEVPLTDAPLIGAPFRLVSFVAKYVSGADLVKKSATNQQQ